MNDELLLNRKILIYLRENNVNSLVSIDQDCTMSRVNLARKICFLCEQSTRNICNILTMGGDE